jgi:hypothetical protein
MSTGGGTTPMGGGGSSGSTFTDDCTKVKKPFNDIPQLKTSAQTLAAQTTDNAEHAITVMQDYDPANPITTVSPGINGEMIIPVNPPKKYIYVHHTHNSPSSSTYSVPSWGDLQWIYIVYNVTHMMDSNTVFMLTTADGTQYALTISDWFGFTQALYMPKDASSEEMEKAKISSDIGIKYLEGGEKDGQTIIPLIQENSTNKEQDLSYFLQMINENSMGINVFEVNSQFNTFTKVTLNPNKTIKRMPCN